MDPKFFRRYVDILSERVVIGPDGKPQPRVYNIEPGPEPTDDEMERIEDEQRQSMGLPSLAAEREAQYQSNLRSYRAGQNPRRFTPRQGDELKEFGADNGPIGVAGRQPVAPGTTTNAQGNDFNTYTTNAQGQRLQQSPAFIPGLQQTKNLDTGDTTTDFNLGPMSASQTKNAAGATTAKAQSVDFGVAKFGTKQQQPNYAAGQLASPTVAKVSVPAGDATVTQKSYAGPMLGGTSGNNVITKGAEVVPNENPAKSAVDPAAVADATATANQLSKTAAPALNNRPGLQEEDEDVELQRLKEFLAKPY
jgi:hypothetical protein